MNQFSAFHTVPIAGTTFTTTLEFRRDGGEVARAADKKFQTMLEELAVAAKLDQLGAVLAFRALKKKTEGIDTDISRLERELRQVGLDREKAMADLEGEALGVALKQCAEQKEELESRIEVAQAGRDEFRGEIIAAEKAARKALELQVPHIQAKMMSNRQELLAEALAELEKAAASILDAAAVADRLHALICNERAIESRVSQAMKA